MKGIVCLLFLPQGQTALYVNKDGCVLALSILVQTVDSPIRRRGCHNDSQELIIQ
jgi:hypothetical protein